MLRYCANLKAIRYESTSSNRIIADKLHRVIVALLIARTVLFSELTSCDLYHDVIQTHVHKFGIYRPSVKLLKYHFCQ